MHEMNRIGASVSQPVVSGQIGCQMVEIMNSLAALEDASNMIASRLGDVVRSAPPATANSKGEVSECLCPLAEQLRAIRSRVDFVRLSINDIRDRVEI